MRVLKNCPLEHLFSSVFGHVRMFVDEAAAFHRLAVVLQLEKLLFLEPML
jgi:hypothetical protein